MFVQHFKDYMVPVNINCVSRTKIKIAFSSHLKTFTLKTLCPGPTMVGPMGDFGYERFSNTVSANSA